MNYSEFNKRMKDIMNRIEIGEKPYLSAEMKNAVNAKMAARIMPGLKVQIIATGETGIVTKWICHTAKSSRGYIAIQVDVNGKRKTYAGRSLRIVGWGAQMERSVRVSQCEGEGHGSCKRCNDNGIWNTNWMCFLNKIVLVENGEETVLDGCYCSKCTKTIEKIWKAEETV